MQRNDYSYIDENSRHNSKRILRLGKTFFLEKGAKFKDQSYGYKVLKPRFRHTTSRKAYYFFKDENYVLFTI